LFRQTLSIRKYKFDLCFDLTSNVFSILFLKLAGIKCIAGGGNDDFSNAYSIHLSNDALKNRHLSLKPWLIVSEIYQDFQIPEKLFPIQTDSTSKLLQSSAVIVPGAGWSTKKIPLSILEAVLEYLFEADFQVYFAVKEKEVDDFSGLYEKYPDINIFKKTLHELFALLTKTDIYIGGDTGITHIAAAFDIPVLAIYCPSNPVYSFPKGKNVRLLRPACPIMDNASTEQCLNSFKEKCPRTEWMNINPVELTENLDLLISSNSRVMDLSGKM
jgi:ADP-heptose:LPS heptosyltransferase